MKIKEKPEEKKTYNGWANYETWVTKLWLDNDQGTSDYWNVRTDEIFQRSKADNIFTKSERARLDLSDVLKSELEESAPDLKASLWSDLLNAAMGEIDWREIANAYLEDNCSDYKIEEV
jgi:hypothetical protein